MHPASARVHVQVHVQCTHECYPECKSKGTTKANASFSRRKCNPVHHITLTKTGWTNISFPTFWELTNQEQTLDTPLHELRNTYLLSGVVKRRIGRLYIRHTCCSVLEVSHSLIPISSLYCFNAKHFCHAVMCKMTRYNYGYYMHSLLNALTLLVSI